LLQKAAETWKLGQAENTSALTLEAYDDLLEVHFPRKQKKARKKLRAERHQAAELYVTSSIAFIKEDATRAGNSTAAKAEALGRLSDLNDVAREYPELDAKVAEARKAFE
jgi:hypothetical protein